MCWGLNQFFRSGYENHTTFSTLVRRFVLYADTSRLAYVFVYFMYDNNCLHCQTNDNNANIGSNITLMF